MADPFVSATADVIDAKIAGARVCNPGRVLEIKRDEDGELDVDFQPGIGRRQGGEVTADGPVPSAPVLYPCGGGFGFSFPLAAGDDPRDIARLAVE